MLYSCLLLVRVCYNHLIWLVFLFFFLYDCVPLDFCIPAVVHIPRFGVSVLLEWCVVLRDLRTSTYSTEWAFLLFSLYYAN